jgi:hypothetical protein
VVLNKLVDWEIFRPELEAMRRVGRKKKEEEKAGTSEKKGGYRPGVSRGMLFWCSRW